MARHKHFTGVFTHLALLVVVAGLMAACGFGSLPTEQIVGATGGAGGGGGTASDFKVNSTFPQDKATAVATSVNVDVIFSDFVDGGSVNASSVLLRTGGQPVSSARRLLGDGKTVRITPTYALVASAVYEITATTNVKNLSGKLLAASYTASFTTAGTGGGGPDTTAPVVVGTSPAAGGTNVPINTTVSVMFSEALSPTTVTAQSVKLTDAATSTAVAATLTLSSGDSVANIKPSANLAANTLYDINADTTVADVAGNKLATAFRASFTTGTTVAQDTTGPICDPASVSTTGPTPADKATNVPVDTKVRLTFNEPVAPASISATTFSLKDAAGTAVTGAFAYPAPPGDNSAVELTPSAPLAPNTTYTITATSGVTDVAGNALQNAPRVYTFTTAQSIIPPTQFTVTTVVPANNATNVDVLTSIIFTFSAVVDKATVTIRSATAAGSVEVTEKVSGAVVECTPSWDATTTILTLSPNAQLKPNLDYNTKVKVTVKSATGTALNPEFTSTFKTGAGTPVPQGFAVASTSPATNAVDHMPFNPIVVQFTEPVDISRDATYKNSFDTSFFQVIENGQTSAVSGTVVFSNGNKTAAWWPEIPGAGGGAIDPNRKFMTQGKSYTLTIKKATKSAGLNAPKTLTADYTVKFSTVQEGFMPIRANPFPGKQKVGVRSGIEVEFSQGVDMPNSNGGWPIELRPVGGSLVAGPNDMINYISPDGPPKSGTAKRAASPGDAIILVFQPAGALSANTTYEVKLKTTIVCAAYYCRAANECATPAPPVKDPAGSPLRKEMVWTFTTSDGAEANDTEIPWTQDPATMNNAATHADNSFNPPAKSFNIMSTIGLVSPATEPTNGCEIHFNELMDPDSISLTNIRYSPFDTNIAGNTGMLQCNIFGGTNCGAFQLAPPVPGIYSVDNSKKNTGGKSYSTVWYIADVPMKQSLGQQFGVNANAFHIDIVSRPKTGAGAAVLDSAGNPVKNNSDNTGGGVIFSVQ
ncbi:MAG: Ig-like domain-containing protein [Planctomycetes bacterium]|nr:Ig-like domain-containing protein [Planctomycetota bacterium]